jgi:hypothetical protein
VADANGVTAANKPYDNVESFMMCGCVEGRLSFLEIVSPDLLIWPKKPQAHAKPLGSKRELWWANTSSSVKHNFQNEPSARAF